jgi:hypothetical protein
VRASVEALVWTSRQLSPSQVPEGVAAAASYFGARDVEMYLNDYEQRTLRPIGGEGETFGIDATVAGRAFALAERIETPCDGGIRVALPLIDGAERLGVLQFVVTDLDDDLRAWCDTFVALVAEMVVSRGQYTDAYFRARRGQEMSLESEMGWHLLRPLTFSTKELAVSAALEPAYAMGGDAFDYAYNQPTLHVALFDAMGHGIQAALTSTLVVAAYRHARRHGADLVETYKAVDRETGEHRGNAFATGVFAEVDCPTGRMQWLNAGHPAPMLLRERSVMRLDTTPALPLGVGVEFEDHLTLDVGQVGLQPGDRVLFFSDGCTEAATPSGEPFGEERLGDFLVREQTAGLGLAETLRRLSHAVLDHASGTLADDATVLLVEYRGTEGG